MTRFRTAGSSIELDSQWVEKMAAILKGQPVGLYARISGQKSLDGSSLESQIAVNRRFALSCGARIVAERMEVITGVFITSRSQFNALLERAEKGEIKFIIVDVRDRLGRGDAISVLEFLARQAGAQIVYATQPADLDTYEGAALDATETLVSRIERLNIRRRTSRGRREWSSEGRIFTGRFYPYGYRVKIERDDKGRLVERSLVLHEEEASVVAQIFQWFVFEDLTTYSIALRLEQFGIPVPEGHRSNRKRTVTQWYTSTIERILGNETYAGVWHYGKRVMQKYETGTQIRYRTGAHPPEHRIPIEVHAIVSRDLWEAAQVLLRKHANGGHPPVHHYLLRGRLRCVMSNANMTGQTVKDRQGQNYGYYTCPHRSGSKRRNPGTRCPVRQIPQRKADHWVWSVLMRVAKEPDRVMQEMEFRREKKNAEQQLTRQALTGVEQEIARVNRQKSELLDLYLNRDRNGAGISREEYEVKARQLNQQLAELEVRRTEMGSQLQADALSPQKVGEVRHLLEIVRLAGPRATSEDKRTLLHLLDVRVWYDGERLELTGCLPTDELTLEELKQIIPADESPFPPPLSAPSSDFQREEADNSILGDHKRSTGCTPG